MFDNFTNISGLASNRTAVISGVILIALEDNTRTDKNPRENDTTRNWASSKAINHFRLGDFALLGRNFSIDFLVRHRAKEHSVRHTARTAIVYTRSHSQTGAEQQSNQQLEKQQNEFLLFSIAFA